MAKKAVATIFDAFHAPILADVHSEFVKKLPPFLVQYVFTNLNWLF